MKIVDRSMSSLFSNRNSAALISLFLVLYGGLAAPKLPDFIIKMFDNAIFRIIVLSLIVYKGERDLSMSVMIAVGFTLTLNIVNKQKLFENFGLTEDWAFSIQNNPNINTSYLKNPSLKHKKKIYKA